MTSFSRVRRVALALGLCVLASAQAATAAAAPAALVIHDATTLQAAIAGERARPAAERLPRTVFLATPQRLQATLSPDGRLLAWLSDDGRRRSVWMQATAGGEPRRVLAQTEATSLAWTRDGRWLLLPTPRQLQVLAAAGQTGSGAVAVLGGTSRQEFLWPDPVRPAAALLLERPLRTGRDTPRWRLRRVEIGGATTVLHEDALPIVDVAIGADGRLAWLMRAEGEAHVLYRRDADGRLYERLRCERMTRCGLLGHAPGDGVWLSSNVDADLTHLLRLDADGGRHPLPGDPRGEAELIDIVLDPVDGQPRFVGYRSTVPQVVAVDRGDGDGARAAADADALRRIRAAFAPTASLQLEVGVGADARWLVHERGDRLRGERLWLYAPASGELTAVAADDGFQIGGRPQPRPDEAAMAHKWPLRWTASDGRVLHGFVTLPPGIDVRRAPVIVSVHGGPFNLVRPEFSNDAQFLANRGYVVFQPNFRGSTGLGRDYVFASDSDFGNGRVQQDIVDGVRWLLANGVGDAQRVGIVGASFGGYAALLGVTFQPELFKVGIAAVPPADFGWVIREYVGAGEEMVTGVPMSASMRHLGLDPDDAALMRRLTEQSPIANAPRMARPLLLLAGGEDERVPIRGVTHYAARLRTLGKDVSLFIDGDAGHGIDDRRTREAYFWLMESMLHRHLGGAEPQPADAELRTHVRRNLRLAGATFADVATLPGAAASPDLDAAERQ